MECPDCVDAEPQAVTTGQQVDPLDIMATAAAGAAQATRKQSGTTGTGPVPVPVSGVHVCCVHGAALQR